MGVQSQCASPLRRTALLAVRPWMRPRLVASCLFLLLIASACAMLVDAQCVPPVPRTYILSATPGEQQPYGVLNNDCPPSRASGVNCAFTLKTGYTLTSGTLTIGCSGTTNTWTAVITGASCTVPALPAGAVAEAGCAPGATLASDAYCYYNVSEHGTHFRARISSRAAWCS
jgi:hypothetical protein